MKLADGVIVGSAIVKFLEQYGSDAPEHIGPYVKSMTEAIRAIPVQSVLSCEAVHSPDPAA